MCSSRGGTGGGSSALLGSFKEKGERTYGMTREERTGGAS